jgi:hypothetical protein
MADYREVPVKKEELSAPILDQLPDMYSVEVVRDGHKIVLRIWLDQHCDPAKHNKID